MNKIARVIVVMIILMGMFVSLSPIKVFAVNYIIAASNSSGYWKGIATAVCDGTADQTEINTYLTTGNTVQLAPGTFNISGNILPTQGSHLYGQGITTILNITAGSIECDNDGNIELDHFKVQGTPSGGYAAMAFVGYSADISNYNVHDITFTTTGVDDVMARLMAGHTASNFVFSNVDLQNPDGNGFQVFTSGASMCYATNFVYYHCSVENAGVASSRIGPYIVAFDGGENIDGHDSQYTITGMYFINCSANGSWESDYHLEYSPTMNDLVFTGCDAQYAGRNPSYIYGFGYKLVLGDIVEYGNTASNNAGGAMLMYNTTYTSLVDGINPPSSTKTAVNVSQGNCKGVVITTSVNHYELVLYSSDGNVVNQTLTLPNSNAYVVSFSNYDVEANVIGTASALVNTSTTSNITNTTATLNGNISSMGTETSVVVTFEYGLTTSYGLTATASESPMTTTGNFHANITGLSTGSVCHFRAKVVGISTVYTSDAQFTTTGTAGTNPYLVINQVSFDNYVVGQISGDNKIINSTGGGTTTTTTSTTSTTSTSTTTTQTPLITPSTGSLIVKYLLPLAIILVTIFMVFRYWKNPIMLICYFIGLMLMLILALNFTNLL